jgi:hypothetical protein
MLVDQRFSKKLQVADPEQLLKKVKKNIPGGQLKPHPKAVGTKRLFYRNLSVHKTSTTYPQLSKSG